MKENDALGYNQNRLEASVDIDKIMFRSALKKAAIKIPDTKKTLCP
ncbi:MAG: hypothetical protein AB8B62_15785 [Roseobacter sp.]